jgi:hypothetical protein
MCVFFMIGVKVIHRVNVKSSSVMFTLKFAVFFIVQLFYNALSIDMIM